MLKYCPYIPWPVSPAHEQIQYLPGYDLHEEQGDIIHM